MAGTLPPDFALPAPADAWDSDASADADGGFLVAGAERDEPLVLALDGWEGPLDLLLDLARRQKVDLRGIWSISTSAISIMPRRCGSNWRPITW